MALRIAILLMILAAAAGAAWAVGTTPGSAWVARAVAKKALKAESAAAGRFEGNLMGTFVARDVKVVRAEAAGGLTLTAQRLEVRPFEWILGGVLAKAAEVRVSHQNAAASTLAADAKFGVLRIASIAYLADKATLEDVNWTGSELLPAGYGVRIQKVVARRPFEAEDVSVVENGRIQSDGQTILLFFARQGKDLIEAQAFSKSLDLSEIAQVVPLPAQMRAMTGELENLTVHADLEGGEWRISGSTSLEGMRFRGFSAAGSRITTKDFMFRESRKSGESGGERVPVGTLALEGGSMTRARTRLDFERGTIAFDGSGGSPRVALKAVSQIDGVKIFLELKGTVDRPEITVRSIPPLPEERIYFMLFTGRGWKALDSSVADGKVTASLTGEMADYLFFGGTGEKAAKRLGIKEWSVSADETGAGAAITKAITPDTSITLEGKKSAAASTTGADAKTPDPSDTALTVRVKNKF